MLPFCFSAPAISYQQGRLYTVKFLEKKCCFYLQHFSAMKSTWRQAKVLRIQMAKQKIKEKTLSNSAPIKDLLIFPSHNFCWYSLEGRMGVIELSNPNTTQTLDPFLKNTITTKGMLACLLQILWRVQRETEREGEKRDTINLSGMRMCRYEHNCQVFIS